LVKLPEFVNSSTLLPVTPLIEPPFVSVPELAKLAAVTLAPTLLVKLPEFVTASTLLPLTPVIEPLLENPVTGPAEVEEEFATVPAVIEPALLNVPLLTVSAPLPNSSFPAGLCPTAPAMLVAPPLWVKLLVAPKTPPVKTDTVPILVTEVKPL
jgi:hypothetical protein